MFSNLTSVSYVVNASASNDISITSICPVTVYSTCFAVLATLNSKYLANSFVELLRLNVSFIVSSKVNVMLPDPL